MEFVEAAPLIQAVLTLILIPVYVKIARVDERQISLKDAFEARGEKVDALEKNVSRIWSKLDCGSGPIDPSCKDAFAAREEKVVALEKNVGRIWSKLDL